MSHVAIAAVVLDMDGLMLDTEALNRVAWQGAAAELGYTLTDAAYAALIGQTTPVSERQVATRFGPAFPLAAWRSRRRELWHERVSRTGIPHKQGLLAFLDAMDALGLPMAVGTSTATEPAEFNLRTAGIHDRFRTLVAGDQVEHGKPAPDIYLEAARRLHVDPSRCVALEDSSAGILAASRAGLVPVLIPDLAPPTAEAQRAAHRRFDSLVDALAWIQRTVSGAPPDA